MINVLASVAISDGNAQTATVGTELPKALVARLLNSTGQPIAGQVVNFVVTSGGGSVFAGAASSDASGYVRERWTLGTTASAQKVEVRAVNSSGTAVVYATFNATAIAGAPQTVSIVSGDKQTAQQLQQLPLPATVIVKDAYGNPVSGVSVAFTVSPGGTVQPGSVMTDASGKAGATWTLGLRDNTLSAVVNGLQAVSFSATATQLPVSAPTAIAIISGNSQTVIQHSLLPVPLQVLVTDVHGNPVPDQQVTFSAAPGSGYIKPSTATTDSMGKASWQGYLHTAGQQQFDASAAGLATVTFNTNVTASNHPYDGNYFCTPSLNFDILNGSIVIPQFTGSGTFNETDGTFFRETGISRYTCFTGKLTIDSSQRVTGAGTYTTYVYTFESCVNLPPIGTLSCERK